MTHDELLARIDLTNKHLISYDEFEKRNSALRAVVELHTADFGTPGEDTVCDYCKVIYPCSTIQAIEKELG